ncbi:MAG: valine--tRNA ligase [Ignavibacteriae bacterium]|nr:valine--tRNA ligase [Ignavibacteriota bacterium]
MNELPKAYNPKDVEDKWYSYWESHNLFHASVNKDKTPYTVVIPPPNITGILTMGHVLNNTIQDILIRWKRMQGYEACWIPGTDHAGIATQNVVEKTLAKEGTNRHQLGREKFLERVWAWKKEYGGTIIKQLRKLGTSCDWQRERFTMDEGLSNAVKEIFIHLFDKGLVYRGKYIVNWCPFHLTALSDDEVEHSESQGNLWHIKYPFDGSADFAVVATTRPETMLGDVAIAVNPKDERYKKLIGKHAILPIVGRKIPIIADDFVDAEFGTGMVKVTPAHDQNDFLMGQRHELPQINIFEEDGRLNSSVPKQYEGMDRFECRKQIVKDLEAQGLLLKTEPHTNNIGRCYRCNTIIEPYISDQWFVKMKPLAMPALRVVHEGKVRFHPERWVKVYEHWMTNIRDWCISRQLWWGHRIPVFYAPDGTYTAARSEAEARTKLKLSANIALRQDEDVLDTWFSSWLWPFSTLGWPEETPQVKEDLRYFNPTDTLVTGPDIIFFWVARMIMANIEVMKGMPDKNGKQRSKSEDLVPFRDVYFTSIIRDAQGRKMSKSLGNSPDPLDVINEYGADALRFTIAYLSPLGQDVLFSTEKCELGRNFANKIWNAGRFLLMNKAELAGETNLNLDKLSTEHLDLADKWILSRLNHAIRDYNDSLNNFRINESTKVLYDFIWHDFCDWYVELVKTRFYGDEPAEVKRAVVQRALWVFDRALRLLHPHMPFLSEELWQHLADRNSASLMRAEFPVADEKLIDEKTESDMAFVQSVINAVRNIRGENNVPPSKEIRLQVLAAKNDRGSVIQTYGAYLKKLGRVQEIESITASTKPKLASSAVVDGIELFVPLEGLIDVGAERQRLEKEIARLQGLVESIEKKLSNPQFVERAPKDVVQKEREKQSSFKTNLEKLQQNLKQLPTS